MVSQHPSSPDAPERHQIQILKVEELLASRHLCSRIFNSEDQEDPEVIDLEIRRVLYWHRFWVFNWLLMNGVSIPANLLTDQLHKMPEE